jgi:uncharacterized repeat protein (TIGR03803 family)
MPVDFFVRRALVLIAALGFSALAQAAGASATTTLYSFCAEDGCADGAAPQAPMVMYQLGTLFGTTSAGGVYGAGTIFSLTQNGGSWMRSTLYSFCAKKGCSDGTTPRGPIVMDAAGNLYGIASSGGAENGGVVFELSPAGQLKVLYDFPESAQPRPALAYAGQGSGAPYDGVSPLFGLEKTGGAFGEGAAFQLSPPVPGKKNWRFATIYSFCAKAGCVDGSGPSVLGALGTGGTSFVGATENGGKKSAGTVFSLFRDGRKWKEKVVHHFCSMHRCADGAHPNSFIGSTGTTSAGGNTQCGGSGCGVLFTLTFGGLQTSFGIVHTFCSEANCADGTSPVALSVGAGGSIFGVTASGGNTAFKEDGGGTLFTINGFGAFSTVQSFCAMAACADGANPAAAPTQVDFVGTMLGTTQAGGANGQGGTIYSLSP